MKDSNNYVISEYLGKSLFCSCGKEHSTGLRHFILSEGAIGEIPVLMERGGYRKAFIVCDENTCTAAGEEVLQCIRSAGLNALMYIIPEHEVVPDERTIVGILIAFEPDCDLVIAVGAGTINDICKFISYKLQLDYYVVATAPSMDGFASTGAPLIIDRMKVSFETHSPKAIIGDLKVLCAAPMDMITAGLGDIIGKYTCLTDWKLSHMVNGEYYCPVIAEMVEHSINKVVENISLVADRGPEAIGNIMEALVLTGIAMSFAGNSRPASGSEHHISHFWEMKFLMEGRKAVLHGTKVGIGAIAVCYMYNRLKDMDPDFEKAREAAKNISYEEWKEMMVHAYAQAAEGVIALEKKTRKNSVENILKRIDIMEKKWPEIKEMIAKSVPPTAVIEKYLTELGAVTSPYQLGIDFDTVEESIIVAKEVRDRYTLLQMLWDLDLIRPMAKEVAEYFSQRNHL